MCRDPGHTAADGYFSASASGEAQPGVPGPLMVITDCDIVSLFSPESDRRLGRFLPLTEVSRKTVDLHSAGRDSLCHRWKSVGRPPASVVRNEALPAAVPPDVRKVSDLPPEAVSGPGCARLWGEAPQERSEPPPGKSQTCRTSGGGAAPEAPWSAVFECSDRARRLSHYIADY
jgi:hypothetical protein